jgi:hypothetical protein
MSITINGTTGIAGVDGSAGTPAVQGTDTNTGMFYPAADTIAWTIGGSERMRIDSSGNLLVGTTSQVATGLISVLPGAGKNGMGMTINSSQSAIIMNNTATAQYNGAAFQQNGTQVGVITVGTTTTAYTTTSDYRLKDSVAPITGALDKVQALKPVTYKWKIDGSDGQGFIAHELQAVVPDCVSGEKDAVDANGNPKYQGIDTSFLIATLTAAIQEQQALITALTTRIETLEKKS